MTNLNKTLSERGARYGKFKDHAVIAQAIKEVFYSTGGYETRGWNGKDMAPDMKQSLETIADKIARILNGDPNYIDNWHDIQGYAKLIEDRLKEELDHQPMME